MNNERIDDLLYKAGLTAQGCWDSMDKYDQEAILKLINLTILECIDQAHGVGTLRGSNDDMVYGADLAASRIANHFGIR